VLVVETLRAVRGKKNELRKALAEIIPMSQKSRGCLQYDLLEPLDQGDLFLVLMRWKSLEDLRNHERSDYIAEFVKKYDHILYDEVKLSEWHSTF
jgi:quinol monooxygenase YgiN